MRVNVRNVKPGAVQILSIAVAVLAAGGVFADGFRNPPEGAAQMGRAGVRLTRGDDPTTITHNPANLMDLESAAAVAPLTVAYTKVQYTSPMGMSEKSKDPWRLLPSVYASMPVEDGSCVLGLGVNTPFGQYTKWDTDGLFKYGATYYGKIQTVNVNPTLATELCRNVNIGLGADIMWSSLEFRQGLPWMPMPAGFSGPGSKLTFDGDGVGVGGNVGLTWQMSDRQRVAVTYRSRVTVDYEGDFEMTPMPPAGSLPPVVTATSDFETEIDFPSVVAFGYGLQATEDLRVEVNVEWVEHSTFESLDVDIENNNALLLAAVGTTSVPQHWDDTWTVGVGVDWAFSPGWELRGGWMGIPTPVPDATMAPVLPESDRNVFAVGLGRMGDGSVIDVAYALTVAEDATVDSPVNPVNGEYEFDSHLVVISYVKEF